MQSTKGVFLARLAKSVAFVLIISTFSVSAQNVLAVSPAEESESFSVLDYFDFGVYTGMRNDLFRDESRFLGGATLQAVLPVFHLGDHTRLEVRLGANTGVSWFYMLEYILAMKLSEDFALETGWSETHLSESSLDGITARQVGMQGAVMAGLGYNIDPVWVYLEAHVYLENMHLVDTRAGKDRFREHQSPTSVSLKIVW